jgi:photosystem II stability/assembly factor-like uncharacterized protein
MRPDKITKHALAKRAFLLVVFILGLSLPLAVEMGNPLITNAADTAKTALPTKKSPTDSWYWLSDNATGADLEAVDCVQLSYCVAVGAQGAILRSTNLGTEWTNFLDVTEANLRGVDCPIAILCFVVGEGGTILKYDGNQNKWFTLTSGTSTTLNDISCSSFSLCYAVGNGGLILRTNNSGSTWQPTTLANTPNLNAIECTNGLICYAVGNAAAIRTTFDGGTTWNPGTNANTTSDLYEVSCPALTICIASTDNKLIRTTGGTTWSDFVVIGSGSYTGVSCISLSDCTAASSLRIIGTKPSDPSKDWGVIYDIDGYDSVTLTKISCNKTANDVPLCLAVGKNGLIVRTTGNFASPQTQNNQNLVDIDCISNRECFAVGKRGTLLRTDNGGQVWEKVTDNIAEYLNFRAIDCTKSGKCAAVTEQGSAYYTNDRGVTWNYKDFSLNRPYDVSCSTENNNDTCTMLYYSELYSIFYSTTFDFAGQILNNGTATGGGLNSLSCYGGLFCTSVGANGIIKRLDNAAWNDVTSPTTKDLLDVDCLSSYDCYAVGANGTWLRYTQSEGWKAYNIGKDVTLKAIHCSTKDNCTVLTATGELFTIVYNQPIFYAATGVENGLNDFNCQFQCLVVGERGTIITNQFIVSNPTENTTATLPGTLSWVNEIVPDGYQPKVRLITSPIKLITNAPNKLSLKPGLQILGNCGINGGATVIDLNNNPGLVLNGGGTSLSGLKLINAKGPAITNTPGAGKNILSCVKVGN